MALPIEDYALIGDCKTAALVGKNGSIDWLAFPNLASGACFAGLLGTEEHGRWLVAPRGSHAVRRKYRGGTLVLETEFETTTGCARVIDFMPLRDDGSSVVRIVDGIEGAVAFDSDLVIRFDYGSIVPWVRRTDTGILAVAGPDALTLDADVPCHGENLRTRSHFTVRKGERHHLVLSWHHSAGSRRPPFNPEVALSATERRWQEWCDRSTYAGPFRDAVMRSLLTLKALTYGPTGGIVAAPTTSLPERIGGDRNWDYRFCWIRDATFALYALLIGGYREEAREWRKWLLRAVAGVPSKMKILYGLEGDRRQPELVLPWLPGYEGSKPVRIGNSASDQHQLDVYGEVMDAMHVARRHGLEPDAGSWRVERVLMRFLANDWMNPDDGIWEVRGPQRHFTHSKVMAWVAADRAVKAVEQFGLPGPVDEWRSLRAAIHQDVCERGFDPARKTFVQSYGSPQLDASLLLIPLVGFLPAKDPRVTGTVEAVMTELVRGGLVNRYATESGVDGLAAGEGTFLSCTFWLADNLALQGRWDEATEVFERLLALRNDVGLLSEEYDVDLQRLVGNFPQAFSHVALINTASNLAKRGASAEDRSMPRHT